MASLHGDHGADGRTDAVVHIGHSTDLLEYPGKRRRVLKLPEGRPLNL